MEDAILQLALQRGVIGSAELDEANRTDPDRTLETGQWGPRIQYLLEAGRLNEEVIAALASDVERTGEVSAPGTFQMQQPTVTGALISDDSLPSRNWDRYELVRLLGQGGMGRVFQAYDPRLKRFVALKFILGESSERARRFLREAQAQARIDHENVCKIYEVHQVEEKPYIAMQYIDGETLTYAHKKMNLREKVMALRDVSEGIHAAHRLGLIHRDIKPGNVMVERRDSEWHPYIMDFGLAREIEADDLTQVGFVMGTPAFMSPEQASGERNLDRRSDVYSLGATLYATISGRPPFEGSSPIEVLSSIANREPAALRHGEEGVPRELETIILKCLEKDAAHRYESARALADDLQRFLDGEPIQARPASWTYRLSKKVRKSPISFAVVVIALVISMIFGFLALQSQWTAQERAAAAQQFGQDVERMDAILRYAHMLPLHDVNAEKTLARQRMQKIATDMARLGKAARGPGEYAIGRGHLSLGEYDEARKRLENAWNYGYRAREVSYALGLAMGRQYEQALERAEKNLNAKQREEEIKRIDRELRDPALQRLQEAMLSETESAQFLAASIAFYQKKYADALKHAEDAARKLPWLYEAVRLQGDVHHQMARFERDRGDYEKARQEFQKADAAHRRAISMAQSDPENYNRLASAWLTSLAMELYYSGGDVKPSFQNVMEATSLALKADPKRVLPLVRKSQALSAFSDYKVNNGEDGTAEVQQAIETANAAITVDPDSGDAYTSRALAYQQLGTMQSLRSEDPRKALQDSISDFLKSIELDPDDMIYNDLGYTYRTLAEYEADRGLDPVPNLDLSIAAYNSALKINPQNFVSFNNLAVSYDIRGMHEMQHGKDPSTTLRLAIKNYQRAVDMSPRWPFPVSNMGISYNYLAEYDLRQNRDPLPNLRTAIQCFQKAIEINPNRANFYSNLATAYASGSAYMIRGNKSPEEWLKLGEESILKALAINHADYYYKMQQAQLLLVRSRWLRKENQDTVPTLRKAAVLLSDARKMGEEDPDLFAISAEASLLEAAWGKNKGAVQSGLSFADHALQLNPDHTRAMATKASLLLVQFDSAEARDLLARAVAGDPSLAADFPVR